MSYTGLKAQSGLNATELEAVKALSQVSKEFDGVAVKLNYSMLDTRKPEQITDFLYYQDGEIVGYMPLDCFGTKAEITAVVHPEYRRRGIFKELYSAAMACPVAASCSSILMVNYRNSEAGIAAVKSLGLAYESSEYNMQVSSAGVPELPVSASMALKPVGIADVPLLASMLQTNFEHLDFDAEEMLGRELSRAGHYYALAVVDDQVIGHIGWIHSSNNCYIRGVGILPAWRGKGWGRSMIAAVMRQELQTPESAPHLFELDVATQNESALSIYRSCGFESVTVYDYYTVPVPI